jgi:hypothetical protein
MHVGLVLTGSKHSTLIHKPLQNHEEYEIFVTKYVGRIDFKDIHLFP